MSQEKPFTGDDLTKAKNISEPQPDKATGELNEEDLAEASGGGNISDLTATMRQDAATPK
jgi:hypothetical protein